MNRYKDILLTTEELVKQYTSINENTSAEYIAPSIYMAQKNDLESVLGTKLVRKLQQLVGEETIDEVEYEYYKELLDDYVTDYLAYATIVRLIPIVSFKIGNAGVVRSEDDKVYNMGYNEVFNIKDYYQQQVDYLRYRMQNYLIANCGKFKELNDNTVEDIQNNLLASASCNIFLGGVRGKKITSIKYSKYDITRDSL